MDRLIEFLTTKVGYVLTVILGFIVPGCQPDHRTEEIRRSKRSYGRPFRPF